MLLNIPFFWDMTLPDVSKDHSASIFRAKQSKTKITPCFKSSGNTHPVPERLTPEGLNQIFYHSLTTSFSKPQRKRAQRQTFSLKLTFPLLPVEKFKRNGICETRSHVMSIFVTSLLNLSICRASRVTKPPSFCKNISPFTNCTSHVSDN